MTYLFFYTDPGSGVMLLQLLLATLAGAGFYFRSFFYRLFGRKVDVPSEESVPATTAEQKDSD
jgi:hypothetical protein